MTTDRKFPWGIVLGVGCLCIICVGVLGLGGFGYYYYTRNSAVPVPPEIASTLPLPTVEQAPVPTDPLIEPEPTVSVETELTGPASVPSLTGAQQSNDHYFYDDFSSDALSWPIYDDGATILTYEDEKYSFQVAEPDYYDWVYAPVDFDPMDIWFDVQGVAGLQDGTFGVMCQYQDEENYNYVEIDLETRSYVIGQIVGDEYIPLTPENDQGQYWQDTDALKPSATEVNRIGVSCYPNIVTLFINDEWVADANVLQPFDELGDIALFVYTFSFADDDGYKVYFDNVEVYKPVQ